MNPRTNLIIYACLFWLIPNNSHADFAAGVEAFGRGDYTVALEEFQQAAQNGDARAINNLGFMYLNGAGVPYDPEIAVAYFEQGVNGYSDALAMANLGWLQITGEGTDKNLVSGVSLLQNASKSSVPDAQYHLALLYQTGHGVDQDLVRMCQLMIDAAKSGYPDAQVPAGVCYEEGVSVPRNLQSAVRYYREAADKQNDSGAQVSLARLLMDGTAIGQDYEEARRLLLLAVDKNPLAAFQLGDIYFRGLGVKQNDQSAIEWYEQALVEVERIQIDQDIEWLNSGLNDASFVKNARINLAVAKRRVDPAPQSNETTEFFADALTPPTAGEVVPEAPEDQVRAPNLSNDRRLDVTRFDSRPAAAAKDTAQANRPTLATFSLVLAQLLVPVMLFYALSFLIFRKFWGLEYFAPSFLVGFAVSWIFATVPVLLFGQSLFDEPGNHVLIPLVPSILVILVIRLRQKKISESKARAIRPSQIAVVEQEESKLPPSDFGDRFRTSEHDGENIRTKAAYKEGPAERPIRTRQWKNTIQHVSGWTLLTLSALGMVMCSNAGQDTRDFVMSPAGAWVWLVWLALLIGGVVLKRR